MIDFHSHLVPGVDDGVADLPELRAALRAMRDQGVTALVTTPHLRGLLTLEPSALELRMAELDAGWAKLRKVVRKEFQGLRVERGVELMLDTPHVDCSDPRLRLAGTGFALVEFPRFLIPPRSPEALTSFKLRGATPVVAHPERYHGMAVQLETVGEWRAAGAWLQVNCGSLLGQYGEGVRRAATELLARGWVDFLSSDYHGRGAPAIEQCRRVLLEAGGEEQVELLTRVNPRRLLDDLDPVPVPPLLLRPTLRERIRSWLG